MSAMTAEKFRMFVNDVKPSKMVEGSIPMSKVERQRYVLRCGLLYLIDYAASESGLGNSLKLRVIRDLANPEVESQPQRWAEQFEEKSEEAKRAHTSLGLYYALAGDLCATCAVEPQGDNATATDGNGDVQLDEVA